jgi:hypothetical protein
MYVCMYVCAWQLYPPCIFLYSNFPFVRNGEPGGVGRDWNLGRGGIKGAAGITATSRSAAVAARSGLFLLFDRTG